MTDTKLAILGPEELVFGVEDLSACIRYCNDFGLSPVDARPGEAAFETVDGSRILLRPADAQGLPPAVEAGATLRELVWGVADMATIEAIRDELSRDRQVTWRDDHLRTHDDMGLGIAFRVSRKREVAYDPPLANMPGTPQRKVNTRIDFERDVRPLQIAHIVLNCADQAKARDFYLDRLGFRVSDSFVGAGTFLRTAVAREHHSLFTIKRPDNGLNHVAFYVTDFHEVMLAGRGMARKGWKTRWGPGRHRLGSNYFWYIEAPMGGAFEYTCDVDHVDDAWVPGEFELSKEMSAIWSADEFPAL